MCNGAPDPIDTPARHRERPAWLTGILVAISLGAIAVGFHLLAPMPLWAASVAIGSGAILGAFLGWLRALIFEMREPSRDSENPFHEGEDSFEALKETAPWIAFAGAVALAAWGVAVFVAFFFPALASYFAIYAWIRKAGILAVELIPYKRPASKPLLAKTDDPANDPYDP